MSPAAKILKLGAENTVANITSYLLHYLGRELEDVNIPFLFICTIIVKSSLNKNVKIKTFLYSFSFQIPESNANCLIDSFLQQLRRVYLVPGEFDGNVIRNMVVVFFLDNLDQYKVGATT